MKKERNTRPLYKWLSIALSFVMVLTLANGFMTKASDPEGGGTTKLYPLANFKANTQTQIFINSDAMGGTVKVALLDEKGNEISGSNSSYTAEAYNINKEHMLYGYTYSFEFDITKKPSQLKLSLPTNYEADVRVDPYNSGLNVVYIYAYQTKPINFREYDVFEYYSQENPKTVEFRSYSMSYFDQEVLFFDESWQQIHNMNLKVEKLRDEDGFTVFKFGTEEYKGPSDKLIKYIATKKKDRYFPENNRMWENNGVLELEYYETHNPSRLKPINLMKALEEKLRNYPDRVDDTSYVVLKYEDYYPDAVRYYVVGKGDTIFTYDSNEKYSRSFNSSIKKEDGEYGIIFSSNTFNSLAFHHTFVNGEYAGKDSDKVENIYYSTSDKKSNLEYDYELTYTYFAPYDGDDYPPYDPDTGSDNGGSTGGGGTGDDQTNTGSGDNGSGGTTGGGTTGDGTTGDGDNGGSTGGTGDDQTNTGGSDNGSGTTGGGITGGGTTGDDNGGSSTGGGTGTGDDQTNTGSGDNGSGITDGGTTGGDTGSGTTGVDNSSGTTGGDTGSDTTGGDNNSGTTPVDVVNPVIPPIIITPDEVDPPVVLPTTVDVVTTPEVAITLPELPLEEDIDIDGDSTPRGDADLDIDVLEDENPRGKANIKDGNRTKKKNASTGMAGKILAKTGGLNNFFAKALMVLAGLSLMLGLTAFRKKED